MWHAKQDKYPLMKVFRVELSSARVSLHVPDEIFKKALRVGHAFIMIATNSE